MWCNTIGPKSNKGLVLIEIPKGSTFIYNMMLKGIEEESKMVGKNISIKIMPINIVDSVWKL